MSEKQLQELIDAVKASNKNQEKTNEKLGSIIEKATEEVRVEKEGNLVEQNGNYINVSFSL